MRIKNQKTCIICARIFADPASNRKITCGPACGAKRRRQSHTGVSNQWSAAARAAARAAAGLSGNLASGTASAQAAALAAPEKHHEAKDWIVVSPEQTTHKIRNLRRWLIARLGESEGRRICAGLRQVAASMRGKTRGDISHAHGWRLAAIPDL